MRDVDVYTYFHCGQAMKKKKKIKNRKDTKSIVQQKHFRKTFRNDDNGENLFLYYIFISLMLYGHNFEVRYSPKIFMYLLFGNVEE